MAVILDLKDTWTAETIEVEQAKVEPYALHVMEENKIPAEVQAKLGYAGFQSISRLRGLGDSRADVKAILKAALGPDADASLLKLAEVASVQAAWEAAKVLLDKEASIEAEERLRGEPRTLKLNDFNRPKRAFEKVHNGHKKMDEDTVPAPILVETLAGDIEEGERKALKLDEIPSKPKSKKEADRDFVPCALTITKEGFLRMGTKAEIKIGMPADTEAFRSRITLLSSSLCFLKFKLSNLYWLKDCDPSIWDAHTKYFLGPKVRQLEAKDEYGNTTAVPSWDLILSYDFRVRGTAAELINSEKILLGKALKKARDDPDVRTQCFITPLAINSNSSRGSKRGAPEPSSYRSEEPGRPRRGKERKDKRKGIGKRDPKAPGSNEKGGGKSRGENASGPA